jgi:hypothetical protein
MTRSEEELERELQCDLALSAMAIADNMSTRGKQALMGLLLDSLYETTGVRRQEILVEMIKICDAVEARPKTGQVLS